MKSPCHLRFVRFAMAVSALGCDGLHYLKIWQYNPQTLAAAGRLAVIAFVARKAGVHVIALSGTRTRWAEDAPQLSTCEGYHLIPASASCPVGLRVHDDLNAWHVSTFLKWLFCVDCARGFAVAGFSPSSRYCSLPFHLYGLPFRSFWMR